MKPTNCVELQGHSLVGRAFWARFPSVGYLEMMLIPAHDQQMSLLRCVWVLIGCNLYPTTKLPVENAFKTFTVNL